MQAELFAPSQGRILVVDDTSANIQAVTAILREHGYQISVATNGRQALSVLERVRPDLILLDVLMPEMDGFEACRRIKNNPAYQDIPIIFLTAKTDATDIVRGFELGAVDYLDANRVLVGARFSREAFAEFEQRINAFDFDEARAQLEEAMTSHAG